MREWDRVFPQYGLKNHKGYSTDQHWKALETHGPTALHRFSFWPVREHAPHALWTGYPRQADLPSRDEPIRDEPSRDRSEPSRDREEAVAEDAACIR
jgi:hypothetical protein